MFWNIKISYLSHRYPYHLPILHDHQVTFILLFKFKHFSVSEFEALDDFRYPFVIFQFIHCIEILIYRIFYHLKFEIHFPLFFSQSILVDQMNYQIARYYLLREYKYQTDFSIHIYHLLMTSVGMSCPPSLTLVATLSIAICTFSNQKKTKDIW